MGISHKRRELRGGQILIRYSIAVVGVFGICAMVDIFRKWVFSIVDGLEDWGIGGLTD